MSNICEHCQGTGILIGAVYLYDGVDCFDADQIARCDECAHFTGDLEAGRAVAAHNVYGSWLVWAEEYTGNLPATENPNVFVRSSPGDAASLCQGLLNEHEGSDGAPTIFARVEFIPAGPRSESLTNYLLELDRISSTWYS